MVFQPVSNWLHDAQDENHDQDQDSHPARNQFQLDQDEK